MTESKHKTWYNYVPLSNVGSEIKDDGTRVFVSIPIDRGRDLSPLELAIIGDEANLDLVRVRTKNTDGNLDQEERHIVGSIIDHALAVLRLFFNHDLNRLYLAGRPLSFGQFGNEQGVPQLHIQTDQASTPPKYIATEIQKVLVSTAPIRVHISLLAEASHPLTPLPFKFLCYYKILELELRHKRKWDGLIYHLQKYENFYRKLDIGKRSLPDFLHTCRDKCAHIKTGKRDELGLVGIGSRDAEVVTKFLPLFNKIVIDLINERHSDLIIMQSLQPTLHDDFE